MHRGVLTAASAAAILAASGLYGIKSAQAADLGGNCCADLEERIAELEATTVRKGNRKVSLTLSGYVSHHVMFWDDGVQSDMYIGDGGNYGSRFRFVGNAKISPHMSAGFLFEWQSNANQLGAMNQANGGDDLGNTGAAQNSSLAYAGCGQNANSLNSSGCIVMRQSVAYLKHNQLGTVKVGHGSTSTDDLILIDVGGMSGASTPDVGLYTGGFSARVKNTSLGVGVVNITWTNMLLGGGDSWDTPRRNHVLYETPTLAGFTLQAAVAEDNFWDVALRYAGEFGGFRLAAGIGYREDTKFNQSFQLVNQAGALCTSRCDEKQSAVMGSASIMHVPTGLFLTGAGGRREVEKGTLLGSSDNRNFDANFWYLAGGISQNFFGFGKTVIFGEYSKHNDELRQVFSDVTGSEVTHWGVGVNQYIDAAAMEIFVAYKNFDANFDRNDGTLAVPVMERVTYFGMQQIIVGTRIQF